MSIVATGPNVLEKSFSSLSPWDPDDGIDWGTATPPNAISLIHTNGKDTAGVEIINREQLPRTQQALLLHAIREAFVLTEHHEAPQIRHPHELIVKIQAIGLNPIDWKSVDYGFGIPQLPYVAGRDFAGIVVEAPETTESDLRVGDVVLCGSTDYRDMRKAAYQEYAIATHFNVCKVPSHVPVNQAAAIGVAFVAAALSLGVCLGLKFRKGPDLRRIVRDLALKDLPADAVPECMAIEEHERPESGDWIAIWGGSSTSALFLSQIARLSGLRVILVVDEAKHGSRLSTMSDCILVDSQNPDRAVDIIRGITGGALRFGVDTVGKDTAVQLAKCLRKDKSKRSHVVGLAALPKEREDFVVYHSVPVKLFHEVPVVGSSLMAWLEDVLESSIWELPRVSEAAGGLSGINSALDMMRQGRISGQRLVVPL